MVLHDPHIERALAVVRKELYNNIHSGGIRPLDYYESFAAAAIWDMHVRKCNLESGSCREPLTVKDIAYICKHNGISYKLEMDSVEFENGGYIFKFSGSAATGGPGYPDYYSSVISEWLDMSPRALMRLLKDFRNVRTKLQLPVAEAVEQGSNEFRRADIVRATVGSTLGPDMDDILYFGECMSGQSGESVNIWLSFFEQQENDKHDDWLIKFSFPMGIFLSQRKLCCDILRLVYSDPEKYTLYKKFASLEYIYDDENSILSNEWHWGSIR